MSTVIPIQKVKGSFKVGDLRSVNMLVTIEKIVYRQLLEYINTNKILITNQSGFRKGHSCETALQNILYDWRYLLNDNYAIGAVFLDLQRAFETVNRKNY